MLNCINNSAILSASLDLLSNNDYDINDEFKTMCTRFGLNGTQMISLVTTLDTTLLNDHYETIWDGLNYYSMACMNNYKTAYIESLYKTDLMDERIELLCDDLKEYIKCNSCINVENNKCSTFKDACKIHHDTCVKYLLNNPEKHDVENDIYDGFTCHDDTNIIDYICLCGGSLDVIKYLFEIQKKDCTNKAIDYASEIGHLDVVKYLFEIQKKDCTTNAIDLASKNGHLDVVAYLFEIQQKDCTYRAIDWASQNGHLSIVKYFFENQKKDCAYWTIDYASQYGHLDIIKYLFEIQKKDCTTNAIDWASQNGHLSIVKYLFEIQKKDCTYWAVKYAKNDAIRDYVKKMKKNRDTNYVSKLSCCTIC